MIRPTPAVAADEIGAGPLSRGSAALYRMLVLEGMLLLGALPSIAVIAVLGRDSSNVPLFVLAMLPLAPTLVAAIAAVEAWRRAPDLSPARAFALAYRRDLGATLVWAAPATALLAVLAFNLVHLDAVPGAGMVRPVLLVVAAVLIVWMGIMLPLTAGFRFRTRDAARIALVLILPQWRYSLGVLSLVLVAATLALLFSVFAVLLLAGVLAGLLALLSRPLTAHVARRFTRHD
ncbi:hypothetical protein [Microbacterium sp. 22242]|uniref:hypothetical protein n=1 Tax=Microbacterium sp. 22242 TaxID=3453896 RepID=UPI003F8779FF